MDYRNTTRSELIRLLQARDDLLIEQGTELKALTDKAEAQRLARELTERSLAEAKKERCIYKDRVEALEVQAGRLRESLREAQAGKSLKGAYDTPNRNGYGVVTYIPGKPGKPKSAYGTFVQTPEGTWQPMSGVHIKDEDSGTPGVVILRLQDAHVVLIWEYFKRAHSDGGVRHQVRTTLDKAVSLIQQNRKAGS